MALANVGELFYQAGLNVLLVDWDLEAPGLERFFAVDAEEMASHLGVIDMLLDYKHQMAQDWTTDTNQFPFKKPSDLTIDLHPDSPKGKLRLLTAGQRDKANFARYANSVLTFDWKDFYDSWEGETYFEWLRQQFLEMADVVLIDSRTGITEMGGVCTYQLGDMVVMFCGTSKQILDGTDQMATELKSSAVEKARGRPLEVVIVPARVDKESGIGDEFKREFLQRFSGYTPAIFKRDSDYFWQLTIPYATVCAYKEMIVTPESSIGAEDVYGAFTRLAFALSRLAPDDSAIRRALLEEEFQLGNTQIVGSVVGGQVVITGHGNVVTLNLPVEKESIDEDAALTRYLDHVIATNRSLQIQGIRSAGQMTNINLEEVYVAPTVMVNRVIGNMMPPIETIESSETPQRERLHKLLQQVKRLQIKVQIQKVLADSQHLVVLGDPGSGKTTLLRYLALTYARDLQGEAGLVAQRLQLREQRLPILLPLRDFARYIEAECPDVGTDGPKLLLDYLHIYFANQDIPLPERFFADRLKAGTCMVLLDGMDEVANFTTHQRIARIIDRFTTTYPENRIVVTSRIVGYASAARLGERYKIITVCKFTDEDIQHFVTYWNRAIEVAAAGEDNIYMLGEAEKKSATLLEAILSTERVRELAVNPLLLTVIALVQHYRTQLPGRRAELYEEAVEILLGTWDEAKGLDGEVLLRGLDLDAGDRRSLLEPLALWMMEQHAHEIEANELRRQLEQRFYEQLMDRRRAQRAAGDFLRFINERSGLIIERGQGIYAFSHQIFQDYLSARAVADREDYLAYTLDRLDDSWWREVILLEVGYLSTQGKQRTTALIRAVMDCTHEPEPYHNLTLAAEALREIGPARVEEDLFGEVQRRLHAVFAEPLQNTEGQSKEKVQALIRRRAAAAAALARVESGRPGTQPAFWTLPYGEPTWVEVRAGESWMGSEKGDVSEKPMHQVHLETFQIAKMPITNTQYRLFVEAARYRPPTYWENGQVPRGLENHPVVNVSWDDARAYCSWLSRVTGKAIMLPNEAQWEKVARGDQDQREYPWGDDWDATKCNSRELNLESETPIGIFPEGASPYGCLDMAGNVWEWTTSLWGKSSQKPDFVYPYDPADGRENQNVGSDVYRVIRGGTFDTCSKWTRCSARLAKSQSAHEQTIGFRVIMIAQGVYP
ncbi:MAG: SUMF1/EgtB/PvdO family nonheme iron enzyme [Anaerolineales bacterium]|nr:SUMF1/EgtB/PvdO family nonheme iron enzyme [Anaerolineales bacterium]